MRLLKIGFSAPVAVDAEKFVAEAEKDFHGREAARGKRASNPKLGGDNQVDGGEFAALKVASKLGFHGGERDLEGVGEGLVRVLALAQKAGHVSEACLVFRIRASGEVMGEEPRLSVEDPLTVTFVVFGRTMADAEEVVQRHESGVCEEAEVVVDRSRDTDTVFADDFKSGIEFGHAFVKPEGPEEGVVTEEQMGVFVKDGSQATGGFLVQ